jgi:hypothetical protein
MAGLNDTAKDLMNDALDESLNVLKYASLHTSDPGSAGDNEATGGNPAYARVLIAWGASASHVKSVTTLPTFNVPAGTYTHVGFWSAATDGTFYGSFELASEEEFTGQGKLALSAIALTNN